MHSADAQKTKKLIGNHLVMMSAARDDSMGKTLSHAAWTGSLAANAP